MNTIYENTCIELNIDFEKPSFGEELRMLEEGFGSVMQSVGNGIRAVIKYILDTLRKFWGWLQGIWAKFRGNVKKKEKELDEREEECSEKIEEKIKSFTNPADPEVEAMKRANAEIDGLYTATVHERLIKNTLTYMYCNTFDIDQLDMNFANVDTYNELDVEASLSHINGQGSLGPPPFHDLYSLVTPCRGGITKPDLTDQDLAFKEMIFTGESIARSGGRGAYPSSSFISEYINGKSNASKARDILMKKDIEFQRLVAMQKDESRAPIVQYISNKWMLLLKQCAQAVQREGEIAAFYISCKEDIVRIKEMIATASTFSKHEFDKEAAKLFNRGN